jgi:hypothetical protein
VTLSQRWAGLRRCSREPCHCHTIAQRCCCAAHCLDHQPFRSPWPPPAYPVRMLNLWSPEQRRSLPAVATNQGNYLWPGHPDTNAPEAPR